MIPSLAQNLPPVWQDFLREALQAPSFAALADFLAQERKNHTVYPREEDLFRAFSFVAPQEVKAVILGQDPYHGEGQAHGLAFSVPEGIKPPPSLKNILKEYMADLAFPAPDSPSLLPWAKEGVLLLNTVLTVRAHTPNSHAGKGWEEFTDKLLCLLSQKAPSPLVFLLWGAPAQKKKRLITDPKHLILEAPHPSPLSAYRGFFGSRPFSKINGFRQEKGLSPINWKLK